MNDPLLEALVLEAAADARGATDPLLEALHKIADLGSCSGRRATLQTAIDIAIDAICDHEKETEETKNGN